MLRHVLLMLGLLGSVALRAEAVELIAGWSVEGVGDSNVLRTSVDEEADFSIRTGPLLNLRQLEGDFQFDVELRPRYEAFTRLDGINAFEYFANGELTWAVTPRFEVSISDDFADSSSLGTLVETTGTGVDQVGVVVPGRQRVTTNRGRASLVYRLGPLWQLTGQLDNRLFEYENPNQTDSTAWSGTAQLTRQLTPRLIVGVGTTAQRQDFAGIDVPGFGKTPDSGTTFFQGFGLFEYQISRTWSLSVSAGPAWATPDSIDEAFAVSPQYVDPSTGRAPQLRNQAGAPLFLPPGLGGCPATATQPCPAFAPVPTNLGLNSPTTEEFVGEGAQPSLTYFGRFSIEKRWRLFRAEAGYERSASNSSGIGTSTILDAVYAELQYKPSERWFVSLAAAYSRQAAASTGRQRVPEFAPLPAILDSNPLASTGSYSPGTCPSGPAGAGCLQAVFGDVSAVTSGDEIDNAVDITTLRIDLRAQRKISNRLKLLAGATYLSQDNQGQLVQANKRDIYRVTFGFNWTFEPIPL